jgi:DNA-binding LacI/PurR family transcriptional regulator
LCYRSDDETKMESEDRSMGAPVKTKVTMRDVARLASVSQSTVSRVLNGGDSSIPIGEETRQRVLDAIKRLNYQPNLYAGTLRGQKTRMIAMMIADIANPFYHAMVRSAQDIAHAHRYDVMITNTDHMRENELHFLESIIRRPVDGVFMAPYHLTRDHLEELISRTGAAVVAVGQHIDHPQVDTVQGDDDKAVIEAVRWLHQERGHQRIGYIGVTEVHSAGARRYAAFKEAMQALNLSVDPQLFALGDWSEASGEEAMRALIALPDRPTAVFAINDLMAIGALEAALSAGLRVPEDVAVIGFDNIPAVSWVRPRLTTVAQFPADMGRLLTQALFERIDEKVSGPALRFVVPCELIVRESA